MGGALWWGEGWVILPDGYYCICDEMFQPPWGVIGYVVGWSRLGYVYGYLGLALQGVGLGRVEVNTSPLACSYLVVRDVLCDYWPPVLLLGAFELGYYSGVGCPASRPFPHERCPHS